jgi:4'-phosphopantetheinyl transferase
MLRPVVAARWTAARWALRHILSFYLGEDPAAIALAVDRNGKPHLAETPERLHFNLSHSSGVALVAVSAGHQVGVDIEGVQPNRDPVTLAERSLSTEDIEAIREAAPAERALLFHQRWARHEARLKCLGVGIFQGTPPPPAAVAVQELAADAGYAAAAAIDAPRVPSLRCWTFDPSALRIDGNRVS